MAIGSPLRRGLQRFWLGFLTRVFPLRRIRRGELELAVMDLRLGGGQDSADLDAYIADALVRLSSVKQGFGELVADHIAIVALVREGRDTAFPDMRMLHLSTEGLTGGHMMACKLIWGATAIRVGHNQLSFSSSMKESVVGAAAKREQLRFVQQFPDWEPWAKALELQPPD